MRVLSLFDGMSCGRLALQRAGLPVDLYHASEIDRHAMTVSALRWSDITQVGDVSVFDPAPGSYDLIIGGSPCTQLSHANIWDRSGPQGAASSLFYHYLRILHKVGPRHFMLENVKMKKEWRDVFTQELGVQPVEIDSGTVSAQHRPRLYWANFPITQPPGCDLVLGDVLEPEPVAPKWYLSAKAQDYMSRPGRWANGTVRWQYSGNPLSRKARCITANVAKGVPYGIVQERNRRLTCIECERLQTLPDDYTAGVPDTARLKMIGNGWTVDVVAHILRGLT